MSLRKPTPLNSGVRPSEQHSPAVKILLTVFALNFPEQPFDQRAPYQLGQCPN